MFKQVVLCLGMLCSGCVSLKPLAPPVPPRAVFEVRVENREQCGEAWNKAENFLASHGVFIKQRPGAQVVFSCYEGYSWISYLLNPAPRRGYAQTFSGFVFTSGNVKIDTKRIIHELTHLLFNAPHSWLGVMHTEFFGLGTGYSDETLKHIDKYLRSIGK